MNKFKELDVTLQAKMTIFQEDKDLQICNVSSIVWVSIENLQIPQTLMEFNI